MREDRVKKHAKVVSGFAQTKNENFVHRKQEYKTNTHYIYRETVAKKRVGRSLHTG